MYVKIAISYVYIVAMPRSNVEPEGFCNQGAPCHLPTVLNTVQLLELNTFCKKLILAQYEAGQV